MKKNKRIVILSSLNGLFLSANQTIIPWQYGLGQPQPAPEINSCASGFNNCLAYLFTQVFNVLIILSGALAVIFFILAGILFMTKAGGKPEEANKIKAYLIWGSIGLVIALSAYGLVKLIEFWVSTGI
ncbi:MAG: pilin [Patescibacteria group bacterium]|nr:pilin [Patescibacteria group bacterium]MCL5258009.1 pilin [Patescibacteria group bacterium]